MYQCFSKVIHVCARARMYMCMRPCRLQKDWQSLLCSLTPAAWREVKLKKEDWLPLHYHFTSRQSPITPSPRSEKERRGQRSPPQPPLTDNEGNTAGRRVGGREGRNGWGREAEEETEEEDEKVSTNEERFSSPAMGRFEDRAKKEKVEKTMTVGREEGGVVVERGVGVKVGSESTL